jgi:uncharacterized protein (TIGR00255 family)
MTPGSLRSMTGFGRAAGSVRGWDILVEVKSVNHKGLDVKLRLPRALAADEAALAALVRSRLERGRVDASIELIAPKAAGDVVDLARVEVLVTAAATIAERWPGLSSTLTTADLLRMPGVVVDAEPPPAEALSSTTSSLLAEALAMLERSRGLEGAGLLRDLSARRARCGELVDEIAAKTASAVDDKRAKLEARLTELLATHLEPSRVVAEAAVLAERLDVAEEIARLRLHLEHLDTLLVSTATGRKIDFLCQELMREANTTASKCQDAATAQRVVDLKAEIERLREQAQNVE